MTLLLIAWTPIRRSFAVDEELFLEHMSNVFIADVGAVRRHAGLDSETAVFFTDSVTRFPINLFVK
jgi:hypothetical protein